MRYALVPGITSEAAGQATRGTALEPAARAAGRILGAGGVAALTRESAAANAVTKAFEQASRGTRLATVPARPANKSPARGAHGRQVGERSRLSVKTSSAGSARR